MEKEKIAEPDVENVFQGERHLDRRWAWVVMVAALLTHILTFGAAYASVGALYVEFLKAFEESESATALTGSITLGTMLCSGPLASILVAKFGTRAVAVCGGVFASSGLILSAFANGLVYLYFTFGFLTGLGYGFSYLPCIVMVGNFFEKRRAVASGIAVSGSGLGTFIIAPIIQNLLETFGFRKTLITLGAMELVLCICGATYIPSRIPVRKIETEGIDVDVTELGSGSVVTASILESTTALAKPSQVSFLMQAALCSSGLLFPGQSRSRAKETDSIVMEEFGTSTPLPQLSDGSVLAQAALCLSRLSPSISSSIRSSSSKLSDNAVTPVVSGSPIPKIPEEWIDAANTDNDNTLVLRRKPDFPPIPEEFINPVLMHGFEANGSIITQSEENTPGISSSFQTSPAANATSNEESTKDTAAEKSTNVYCKSSQIPTLPHRNVDVILPVIQINDNEVTTNVDDDNNNNASTSELNSRSSSIICPKSSSHSAHAQPKGYKDQLLMIARLFKNRYFVLFSLSNLFVCIGYQLPYMYFKAFAISMDLGEDSWALILSVMGVTDTLGRILVGFSFNYVTTDYGRLFGYATSMVISGTILALTSLANSYVSLLCFAAGFALVAGSTDSLVAALLVGFVGLDTLGYSFGMTIEMQGIGFIAGPPIAGFLYTLTGTYTAIFCTGGVAFILSGLVVLLEPIIVYLQGRKET